VNRSDMLVELASDQVNQVQQLLEEDDYASVHSWLQPLFLEQLKLSTADMQDDNLEAYYCTQMGVDRPSSPPLSSEERAERWRTANAKEKAQQEDSDEDRHDPKGYAEAEAYYRSLPVVPDMEHEPVSIVHQISDAKGLGKMATPSPVPPGSEASLHWVESTPEI